MLVASQQSCSFEGPLVSRRYLSVPPHFFLPSWPFGGAKWWGFEGILALGPEVTARLPRGTAGYSRQAVFESPSLLHLPTPATSFLIENLTHPLIFRPWLLASHTYLLVVFPSTNTRLALIGLTLSFFRRIRLMHGIQDLCDNATFRMCQ